MPGRLRSFVTASATSFSSTAHVTPKTSPPPASFFPPIYSQAPPSQHSQESLIMEALKRHSLGARHQSDKKIPKSPKIEPQKPVVIDMILESPPVVFYNPPATSTGAILSGQLRLHVKDPRVTVDSFSMRLIIVVSTRKPVHPNCPDCTSQVTEIGSWKFLKSSTSLLQGDHAYPFSHLIEGHLPATSHGSIASLDYYLDAVAALSDGDKVSYRRVLDVKRAIFPGNEKNSLRIFPPTNLTAAVTLPPVIHPIGDFPITMRLSGVTHTNVESVLRWRLRKLSWRIEETQTFVSPACPKHASKVGGPGKGVRHEDTRQIAGEEVKMGWKSDFEQGYIDCEFRAACNMALKPLCDMESASGMSVKHSLIIEMVVAEEMNAIRRPQTVTPTGAARVLRTQFHISLTERSGMGISWDEEQPPVYEDVPASPPTYVDDVDVASLEEDAAQLRL